MEAPQAMAAEKAQARDWFEGLQGRICAAFEGLEDMAGSGARAGQAAGRFERKATRRDSGDDSDAGGGTMAVMRGGRVFEKVGVNVSTVYGTLGAAAQKAMSARPGLEGLAEDPRFWASGISLVAHMQSPKAPAVHMNTRMFWTPVAHWFGGGADLNPALPVEADTAFFHDCLRGACEAHPGVGDYPKMTAWADEYFMIRHWGEPRGVGGIFYDDLNTGDWAADFAFTRAVGEAFLAAFVPITERRMGESWTEEERDVLLVKRGRYAEFNLVYDRGTQFGLQTGHNPEAVLMSLPPVAKWP